MRPIASYTTRAIHRVVHASDASVYRIVPKAVAWPKDIAEIQQLLAWCQLNKMPITFRAGGTSLSGQAVGPGLIANLTRNWNGIRIEDNGNCVYIEPGMVGAHVNEALASFGKKIGPDPASLSAAMIGGIIANNSSGMCCGVEQNAYHTLSGMTLVLANGVVIDSRDGNEKFRANCPEIYEGLLKIRDQLLRNPKLVKKVRHKYRYKNTTGYGLNALLDFQSPLDILCHLVIGSEGTLAFIANVTLHTVPCHNKALTGMLFYASPEEACNAIAPLTALGATAIELLDRKALASVENLPGSPQIIGQLPSGATALLVEFQSNCQESLKVLEADVTRFVASATLINHLPFSQDPMARDQLWHLRKGTFPAVGAMRPRGTSVIIEDVVFTQETLAAGVCSLQKLFEKHSYHDAIIFGHAKDGNMHFVISQDFEKEQERLRYDLFLRDLVTMVTVEYGGALKGEHGTGRNMAPFVEKEWGNEAYSLMHRIKNLLDPNGILNPGVIFNTAQDAHVRDLKNIPSVDELIDKCIECGYCAPICPSEKVTLSPRDRIVVARELARTPGNAELAADYQFFGLDSCATDGMCATQCPVEINTGRYIKKLRQQNNGSLANAVAWFFSKELAWIEPILRTGLTLAHGSLGKLPAGLVNYPIKHLRNVTGVPVPFWSSTLPFPQKPIKHQPKGEFLLFPTCVNRTLGSHSPTAPDRTQNLVALCEKAKISLGTPQKAAGQCCGMPFYSKGLVAQGQFALTQLINMLWKESDEGRIPIIIDNSPCTYTLIEEARKLAADTALKFSKMKFLDIISFLHDEVITRVPLYPLHRDVYVYPVCSVTKMGLTSKLAHIAQKCSTSVSLPVRPACCGQAGDRGFYYPELVAAGAKKIQWPLPKLKNPSYYSTSRTCECALSAQEGGNYSSIIDLVLEAMADPNST